MTIRLACQRRDGFRMWDAAFGYAPIWNAGSVTTSEVWSIPVLFCPP